MFTKDSYLYGTLLRWYVHEVCAQTILLYSEAVAIAIIAGSSNGRTVAFEAIYLGSNPSPAAS